jgi:cysteine desulfuration protein SufE
MYPPELQCLVDHFESLPEGERREGLIDLAEQSQRWAPKPDVAYQFEEVRKDAECSDTVGIHVHLDDQRRVHFAVSLGCAVQTLTRAMTTILCRGLSGSTAEEVVAVPKDFVPRIVGAELVQMRARTVYYLLGRMKEAAAQITP